MRRAKKASTAISLAALRMAQAVPLISAQGVTVPGKIDKMGYKGIDTTEMVFEGHKISADQIGIRTLQIRRHGNVASEDALPESWSQLFDARLVLFAALLRLMRVDAGRQ